MEYVLLAMVVATIGYYIVQGFKEETRPAPPMRDVGNGVKVPVCPKCQAQLVTVQRKGEAGLAGVLALLVGAVSVALMFVHILAGLVGIIVAVLIHLAGRTRETVLTCPACGTDARVIR